MVELSLILLLSLLAFDLSNPPIPPSSLTPDFRPGAARPEVAVGSLFELNLLWWAALCFDFPIKEF